MATAIRDITGGELSLFGDIVARLERLGPESDARSVIEHWLPHAGVKKKPRNNNKPAYVSKAKRAASTKPTTKKESK